MLHAYGPTFMPIESKQQKNPFDFSCSWNQTLKWEFFFSSPRITKNIENWELCEKTTKKTIFIFLNFYRHHHFYRCAKWESHWKTQNHMTTDDSYRKHYPRIHSHSLTLIAFNSFSSVTLRNRFKKVLVIPKKEKKNTCKAFFQVGKSKWEIFGSWRNPVEWDVYDMLSVLSRPENRSNFENKCILVVKFKWEHCGPHIQSKSNNKRRE